MSSSFIPVNTPLFSGKELEYLTDCIKTGWVSSEGSYVEKFESAVAEQVNRQYGVAVSNGTAAIDIAIAALNISEGMKLFYQHTQLFHVSCRL